MLKLGFGKAENPRDVFEVGIFRRMVNPIGHGDMKQRPQQILEHRRAVPEHPGDLPGVGLVSGAVLARHIENPPDIFGLMGGDLKNPLEDIDLLAGDMAVGLGHLGGKRNYADRESDLPGRLGGDFTPGLIKTAFSQALWDNPQAEQRVNQQIPMRRLGEADDLKGLAVFLASDASSYITGQALTV
ncbi:MAG: SDR family oxidoreductase, partial [Proteobacteria bacterium]|nr:SDR family oxidoreductase [Pseudomonadota bacterium]